MTADYETPAVPQPPPPPAPAAGPVRKSPGLAAFLALFPGLGHLYNGLYTRGAAFFAAFVASILLTADGHWGFAFVIAFTYLFNILDAYRQAQLINYGYATDLGLADRPAQAKPGQGGLAIGIVLLVLGLYGLLTEFFYVDLDFLWDLWPFAFLGFGAWLVWSAVRAQRKAAEPEDLTSEGSDPGL